MLLGGVMAAGGCQREQKTAPPQVKSANYGDDFPRLDAPGANVDPKRVRLVVNLGASERPSGLPVLAALRDEHPELEISVLDGQEDPKTKSWLEGKPFKRRPWSLEAVKRLEEAAADGVARESIEVAVFHGPWVVWMGRAADVRPVVDAVLGGHWSQAAFREYESIRSQLNAYAQVKMANQPDTARMLIKGILARPNAAPSRLIDLSASVAMFMKSKDDAVLAGALAERALKDTKRLDYQLLVESTLTFEMVANNEAALDAARAALELCRTLASDCEREADVLKRAERCPMDLVAQPTSAPTGDRAWMAAAFLAKPKAGTPADCDQRSGK